MAVKNQLFKIKKDLTMSKKAASVFVQTLKNHGVDRFFCVPGESYLSLMDELLYSTGIEVVTCRH